MDIIHTIALSRLQNGEYIQLMRYLIGIVDSQAAVKAAVITPFNALGALVAQLDLLFGNDPASALSDDLAEVDANRDRIITGLALRCKADTYHPVEAKRNAAAELSRNLEIHGDRISIQSYNAESAIIASILTDWATKPNLMSAVTLLELSDWIAALANANDTFRNMYSERIEDMASATAALPGNMRQKRKETDAAWNTLRTKIDGHYIINDGAAPWSDVASQMNTLIDQYKHTLATRAGRAAAKSNTPPPISSGS